jgi:tetratricopeptide (TPR) repeat protein
LFSRSVGALDHRAARARCLAATDRRGADVIRTRFPEREPLSGLRAWPGASRLFVHREGAWMEPDGQLVLAFVFGTAAGAVETLASHRSYEEVFHAAREWFVRGSELDLERATWNEAAECYRRAIDLDPTFADAHCNLGSLLFNRGRREDARRHFERTVEIAPRTGAPEPARSTGRQRRRARSGTTARR